MNKARVLSIEQYLRDKLALEDVKSRVHAGPAYYGFHAIHVPSSILGQAQINKILIKLRLRDELEEDEQKVVNKLLRKYRLKLYLTEAQVELVNRVQNLMEVTGQCGQPCP